MTMMIVTRPRRLKDDTDGCILLDIDSKKLDMSERYVLLRLMGIEPEYIRTDRTERGWHVIIPAPHLSPIELIAAQAILGSDARREALNFFRFRKGAYMNLLFEPKEKVNGHKRTTGKK